MTYDLAIPAQLTAAFLPDLIVMGSAMVLLLWAAWRPESERHARSVAYGAMLVCVAGAIAVVLMAREGAGATSGVIAVDGFRWAADLVILLGTFLSIALTADHSRKTGLVTGEAHVLMVLAAGGMMLLAAARDLTLIFLGIELMSIAVYVLAAVDRRSARSAEAGLKYFLLGAFSTGFLLYGIALVYGATGSTNLERIGAVVGDGAPGPMLLVGVALLIVGFAFKVAAVPFHMWTPDVYDGAPTPVTAFMATAVKAAAFVAFTRVLLEAFPGREIFVTWHTVLWWMALATMLIGNLVALAQRNLKRMLAYSSIAHAGYLLVTLVVNTPQSAAAMLFYLLAYTLATAGAFAVMIAMNADDVASDRPATMADYAGLFTASPRLAIAMAIFMLALLGFPLAGGMGFFAKWYVLQAALQVPADRAPQTALTVALVLTSVLSAGYYLYLIMVMFMRPRADDAPPIPRVPAMTRNVILGTAVVLIVFGVYPSPIVRWARASAMVGARSVVETVSTPVAKASTTAPVTVVATPPGAD